MAVFEKIKEFLKNEFGNIAIYTAIVFPIIAGGAGAAIDLSSIQLAKTQTQSAADAASLAVANKIVSDNITISEAKILAAQYFTAQLTQGKTARYDSIIPVVSVVKKTVNGKIEASVTIDAKGGIKSLFPLGFIPEDKLSIDIQSFSSSSSQVSKAVSMYMVLDVSGSMAEGGPADPYDDDEYDDGGGMAGAIELGGLSRMEALKQAAYALTAELKKADPDKKFVRTGAVAYESYEVSQAWLNWGVYYTDQHTASLWAYGGTNSGPSMYRAYMNLRSSREATEHYYKNGQNNPDKVIIFMTDGENNYDSEDAYTLNYCTAAKEQGMIIYAIAFDAPPRGEALLSACATDSQHYYNAATASELVATFRSIGAEVSDIVVTLKK